MGKVNKYTGTQVHKYTRLRTTHYAVFLFIFHLSSFILSACSQNATVTITTLPTTYNPAFTFVPSVTASPITLTPSPTPAPPITRPQYTLDLQLNYATKSAYVDETIVYVNQSADALTSLVLGVEPTCTQSFILSGIFVDGLPITDYVFDVQNIQAYIRHRLEIPLAQPLLPGGKVTIQIGYSLILPVVANYGDEYSVCSQIFGYTEKQINLVDWYPFVAPYVNGKFVLHNPWYYGEHLTYEAADFDVTVQIEDGANVVTAASGEEIAGDDAARRRFRLEAGRTFALSFSDSFQVASTNVGGVTIFSYYFPNYETSAQAVLAATAQSFEIYSQRFGPYPHKTLTVAQGDFEDGMEYSAFYFHSRGIYNNFDGTLVNHLTAVSVHETAHQWWFEQVANDQGIEPWLDESLATFSEIVYYETVQPDALDSWWWTYRFTPFEQAKPVDASIYDWYGGYTAYQNLVYLNGARFLYDLRARIGDEAFFAFIQDYLAQERGKIASAPDFFRILRAHTAADLSGLIALYFQNSY
ncbi:MAG: M1 family metallopeptidase [Chloroflexota bacterium]